MENSNVQTQNQNEDTMSQQDLIVQMFQSFLTDGGLPKVTDFKRHIDSLIKDNVKPLCFRSGKSPDGDDWRSQLKARFSGRGAKWVIVPLKEINPTISEFESQGIDCNDYKTFVEANGAAWLRFAGPRIDSQGNQAAAFEVRTGGSKIDHPKQLHYIPVDQLDETIRPLGGTPHSLKLEGQEEKSETKDLTETEVSTDDTETINTEETYTEELVTEEDLLNYEFADLMNDETA
tara:strand:- start:2224 stop:2922 length:699 start_codon:yes stop_codon:yes gene_type:complete